MTERERQESVAARLEMMERIDPEGARLIREELKAWQERSMNQAQTIAQLMQEVGLV